LISSEIKIYLAGCSNKTRLLIYLLATGDFSFHSVRKLTINDLRDYCVKVGQKISEGDEFLLLCNDICFQREDHEYVFSNQSGRLLSEKDVQKILMRAHERVDRYYGGLKTFVELLKTD